MYKQALHLMMMNPMQILSFYFMISINIENRDSEQNK